MCNLNSCLDTCFKIDFADLKSQNPIFDALQYKIGPGNKEMERFTSDGGHLGRHLEYLKFLNDAS